MTRVELKPPVVTTVRKYDVEGAAPETTNTEAGGKRTVTIRPRTLELRTTTRPGEAHDPTIVTSVCIEGRQVRKRDGELGPSRLCSWCAHWREEPPGWILEIIKSEGLWYGE